ncbi:MAG: exodeoxyribonuclease V subunit alpha [Chitinophagaceae bacterium]
MDTLNDVHLQFAKYFRDSALEPYLYKLSQKMEEGSTCLDLEEVDDDRLALACSVLVSQGANVQERPFVLDKERLYMQRYFRYEIGLIEKIKAMVVAGNQRATERAAQLATLQPQLNQLFPSDTTETDWQKIAACFALLNDFTIITGGPGTGKTTTVSKILELLLLQNPDITIALAAPTGKAAARMTESLRNAAGSLSAATQEKFAELKPSTIHRLLGTVKDSLYFKHGKDNPLVYDVIIVDECSMIDIALFSTLLDAIGEQTRLILLGDKDQLSSVEVGSLFGDLCKTVAPLNHFSKDRLDLLKPVLAKENIPTNDALHFLQNNIVVLQISRRFDKEKGIGKLADAVIYNRQDALEALLHKEEEQIAFDFSYSESVWKDFAKGYADYIETDSIKESLLRLDHQRMLCAVREGEHGTVRMNQKIEDYLLSQGKIDGKGNTFYHNRPIMVLENNYELGLYNGDIGLLRKGNDGVVKAWFLDSDNKDTGLKSVLPGLISKMETVFAMTIHKSQGSEFDRVMVVLPDSHRSEQLLTREILYTAVTRAKRWVLVAASQATIRETAERQVRRSSGVGERL